MWSNDYPHQNSTWPNSRDVIARDMGHLAAGDRAKLLSENVTKLYDLKVPASISKPRVNGQAAATHA
jgi:predicted TIM-barrel fold metal-dependent hydrolase